MWVRHLVLLASLAAALCAAPVRAGTPGTIVFTDKRIDADPLNFDREVKDAARTSVSKNGDNWKLSFVAYLRKAPGAEEINIVFYDPANLKRGPVNHYPIRTKATAKILVAEVEIKPEDGFKAGNKYDVRITRLIGGREEVYARTTLQLTE